MSNLVYQKPFGVGLSCTFTILEQLDIFGVLTTVATEFLISDIKNCLTCLQLKRAPSKCLKTPLQPVTSLAYYPGETDQINLAGQLRSLGHHCVDSY